RAQAKITWIESGITPDEPNSDDDEGYERRDCRYDVARLLVFRGDCRMSQGYYVNATNDYREALEIYPNPGDLGLFRHPASQSEIGLSFLQLLRKPVVYQEEIRRYLSNVQRNDLIENVATLKAVALAWANAEFSEQANVLERVWKDHMKEELKDLLARVLT